MEAIDVRTTRVLRIGQAAQLPLKNAHGHYVKQEVHIRSFFQFRGKITSVVVADSQDKLYETPPQFLIC